MEDRKKAEVAEKKRVSELADKNEKEKETKTENQMKARIRADQLKRFEYSPWSYVLLSGGFQEECRGE